MSKDMRPMDPEAHALRLTPHASLGANCLALLFMDGRSVADAHRTALDRVREAGFALTEISHPGLLPVPEAPRVRRHAEEIGLAVRAVHAPPMRRDPTLMRQRTAAALAAELGARILVVHVSSIRFASPDPSVRAAARESDLLRLEALASFCEGLDVSLGLENGTRPGHGEYLLGLLDTLGRPDAGLVFDSGHAALRGGNPIAAAQRMLPRLLHTHLHDNHGARDEHLPPGDGTIDWPALLGALRAGGYTGARLLELRPHRGGSADTWARELARGREALVSSGQ